MSILSTEILPNETKVTLILGPLGSGKTSLVKRLLPHYPKDTILIINDVGAINIDSERIEGNEIVPLTQGCVCCDGLESLREALINLKGKTRNIIIEPSGIAEGTSIKKVLNDLGYDVSTICLGDIEHHKNRDTIEKEIIENQIRVADIIGLTWDSGDKDKKSDFKERINNITQGIETIDIPRIDDNREYDDEIEKIFKEIASKIINTRKQTKIKIFQLIDIRQEKCLISPNNLNKNPLFTISVEKYISLNQLKEILKNYPYIIRAKGIVGNREFDYVHGSLNLGKYTKERSYMTFISTQKIDINLIDEEHSENILPNNVKILDFELSNDKISKLLQQYKEYISLEKKIQELKERLKNDNNNEIIVQINTLQLQQKQLGESMKYDNPYIWLEYKRLAYVGTDSKVETIKELRKHCESPTYICHKRLYFLNTLLKKYYNIDIFDSSIDENMTIKDFLTNGIIQEISQNEDFMKEWLKHEYFEFDGRISKWENFKK